MRRKIWSIVHNVVAHPLLELETDWATRFHDWTSDKAWPPSSEPEGGSVGYDPEDLEVRLGEFQEHVEITAQLIANAGHENAVREFMDSAESGIDALYEYVAGSSGEKA